MIIWKRMISVSYTHLNYYTATDNETFPIGVYLNGDSKIGTYEVKISYDNRRLEYTGGGDSEENGVIKACCGCAICRIWQSWPAGCVPVSYTHLI